MLQGMGAAPELTPLPSIGLSDMEELGLMEPRQAPAPKERIQAVARRLSEPAAEAAEPPHAQECATTGAAPGEAWSPMSRGRSKEPGQAPPAGASAGSRDAKQGMPRIPDGQVLHAFGLESALRCSHTASAPQTVHKAEIVQATGQYRDCKSQRAMLLASNLLLLIHFSASKRRVGQGAYSMLGWY